MIKKTIKMNQTAFAAHMGVVKSYVTELKQAGRLVFTQDGKVDVAASEQRIAETADPGRVDVKERHARARGVEVRVPTAPSAPKIPKEKNADEIRYQDGRAKEQHFRALQAELDYKKSIGEVVNKEDVQHAIADLVTTFRQEIENLPHRIAADLVGKDIDTIRSTLKQEAHAALHNLQRGCNEKIQSLQDVAT